MTAISAPRPFTPSQEAPAELEDRTVGRAEALAVLAQRLRSAATTRSRPHTLILGPRGAGKTHLLRVALHQLEREPEIRDRLAIADISEDALGITRYSDLLWEIGSALDLGLPRSSDVVALESAIIAGIGERTLVIVLENLDRVFRALGTAGQQNLRSWVETSGRVMLLAATPALFAGVRDRSEPWFAGLIPTPVEGLSASEGRELLTILARKSGDDELAEFLQTERGGARLEAVARLTGGSPRIWMVLSECLTVDNLDALVPAVEQLVEGLVPYYQQLLWDLPDNQQAIVRQLADGAAAALTAADIAQATGLSQQTVSKALSLLEENRWVQAQKLRDDKRKTWYSLREAMLRHHFQWRTSAGEPLNLIVELLRAWYDPRQLRRYLAGARPVSLAEAYLAESLLTHPAAYDDAYYECDPDVLAAEARLWMKDTSDVFTRDCGRYVELCVRLAKDRTFDIHEDLAQRAPGSTTDAAVEAALAAERGADLGTLLAVAVTAVDGDTAAGLGLVAAAWAGQWNSSVARALLSGVRARAAVTRPATRFAVEIDYMFWGFESGEGDATAAHARQLLSELTRTLGPDHNLGLRLRSNLADYAGQTGDPAGALAVCRDLLPDVERVLGPDSRNTLRTRAQIAHYTGATGDPAAALTLCRALLSDVERTLDPDHRNTLLTRAQIAYYTGEAGDPAGAVTLYRDLLPDWERTHGPDHYDTLLTRGQIAYYTGEAGDPARALALFRDLLPNMERTLGADDPDTLLTRAQIALHTGETGDPAGAIALYRDLLPDSERALGPDDRDTLTTRRQLARLLAEEGRVDEAVEVLLGNRLLAGAILDVLEASPSPPTSPVLFTTMWHAINGVQEAEVKLPAELRQVIAAYRQANTSL